MSTISITAPEITLVSPPELSPSSLNPRRRFLQGRLVEMADSIRAKGVLQPLKARRTADGRLEIVWGERRWRGATMVYQGYEDAEGNKYAPVADLRIPVMVEVMSDAEVFEVMMLENLEREDLAPSEEAAGYQRMMEVYGLSQAEVSRRLGVPSSRISKLLPLLDLPNAVMSRVDDGDLPLYVAQEALRVPAEWNGGESRMEALRLAEEAGNPARAHELIESRWLRPAREAAAWESDESLAALREMWGPSLERLPYRLCREIFPAGITSLTAVTAGDYVGAEEVPKPPTVHYEVSMTWRELATTYGAPVYGACDGAMGRRLLVRRDLVAEAVRSAHTQEVEVVDHEGGRAFSVEGAHVSAGDRVALMRFSHGSELPQGYVAGRIYSIAWTEVTETGQVFALADVTGSVPLPLHGPGAGRVALLDVSRCPFLPLEGRTAVEAVRQESAEREASAEATARARRAAMMDMVGRAEMAIRGESGTGRRKAAANALLAKAVQFLAVAGAVGLSHEAHPGNRLMVLLDKPEDEGSTFSGWAGLGEDLPGSESFAVCCWLLYFLEDHEGDLERCEQWAEVVRVYGV
jgi:ParB family chromosome partitioning protein